MSQTNGPRHGSCIIDAPEQSNCVIVTQKGQNKFAQAMADSGEGRTHTKENTKENTGPYTETEPPDQELGKVGTVTTFVLKPGVGFGSVAVMSRIARVVVADVPCHITHRGNRREPVFFEEADWPVYLSLLGRYCAEHRLDIRAWCAMTNHVHLIAVPRVKTSMVRGVGLAHRHYSRLQNVRHGWTGHLWANRFYSSALDGDHLWEAVRYVECNPVRAGLAARAEDRVWLSCRENAGLVGSSGPLAPNRPFPGHIGVRDWARWVNCGPRESVIEELRVNTITGRPSESREFVERMEQSVSRSLTRPRMGRPRKTPQPAESPQPDLFEGET